MTIKPSASPVTVRVLVDNEAMAPFEAEYGLSFWIEADGRRILFDTGQGKTLLQNARRANVDLTTIDHLVISHGHYDHSGGLPQVLELCPQVPLYAHPGWLRARYAIRNEVVRPIHVQDEVRERMKDVPLTQRVDVATVTYLTPNIGLTGAVPRETSFEDTGGPFYLDPQGREEDLLEDDMALWIATAQGLVICVGCSHSGVVNIIHRIRSLYPAPPPVRAVLGGFHLMEASAERVAQTVNALRALAIPLLMPCHCTGAAAFEQIRASLGASVVAGGAGKELVFD